MDLKEIQKEIEKSGFSTSIKEDVLICGKNPQTDPHTGIKTTDTAFGISVRGTEAVLKYFCGQIAQENKFRSVNLLIEYVGKNFSS